jgi:SatD family (SatD)
MGDFLKITHIWVTMIAGLYHGQVGGRLVRASQCYIAVISDMVSSRSVPRPQRLVLQEQFAGLIASLNRDYRKTIVSKFVITLGDEFQGLLSSTGAVPDLIWRLEQDLPQREFRVGIGLGTLDTPLQKYALNIDGPALHTARAAIEHAKKAKALGGVFRGFGELDDILSGVASLLWFQRSRWTQSQRNIAGLLRKGMSQIDVAKKLGIKKQVVSRQVLASGCYPYIAGDNAWRMILQKQADFLLGSKHAVSQSH